MRRAAAEFLVRERIVATKRFVGLTVLGLAFLSALFAGCSGGALEPGRYYKKQEGFSIRVTRPEAEKVDGYLNCIDFYKLLGMDIDYPCLSPCPIAHPGGHLCPLAWNPGRTLFLHRSAG